MQHKITKPSKLLNKHGKLIQTGYATYPILAYRRKDVAKKFRLKEWDYYLIYNNNYAIAFTVGTSINLLLINVTFLNLKTKEQFSKNIVRVISDKTFHMPESPTKGNIEYQDLSVTIVFEHEFTQRHLQCKIKDFNHGSDLEASFLLLHEPIDSMVIATPFKEDVTDFYYNQKTIGMQASGYVLIGDECFSFLSSNSFGLLDWGRGVWPYKTTWYWSAAQGVINGSVFGFNLGYGFGDTSAATENMLFYNGIASKLEEVTFIIPKDSHGNYEYMKPWDITSSDERIEMVFVPILERSADINAIVLSTKQHQVFGKFTGRAILDNGTIIDIQNFLGFAERVQNRW